MNWIWMAADEKEAKWLGVDEVYVGGV